MIPIAQISLYFDYLSSLSSDSGDNEITLFNEISYFTNKLFKSVNLI